MELLIAMALIHIQVGNVQCWANPGVYGICKDGNEYAYTFVDQNGEVQTIEVIQVEPLETLSEVLSKVREI